MESHYQSYSSSLSEVVDRDDHRLDFFLGCRWDFEAPVHRHFRCFYLDQMDHGDWASWANWTFHHLCFHRYDVVP